MNVLAVVGARLNSSRLPGKYLLPLAGEPMIEHLVRRLEQCRELDAVCLATCADPVNDPLRAWAKRSYMGLAAMGPLCP